MQTLSAANVETTRLVHPGTHPLKIVALGDSLIYGFGDPVGGGWIERLRRQWLHPDSSGHVLYNLGIRGDGVIQVAQRWEQEFRTRGELRNRVPDLIILSVGLNDSARLGHKQGRYFTEVEIFQQQLNQLLDRARQLCPVLFIGMVPVDEKQMPFLQCLHYTHADQYLYKEITRQACEEKQIPYLDIFKLWTERGQDWLITQLSADGLHPNVEGYRTILKDVSQWQPFVQAIEGK